MNVFVIGGTGLVGSYLLPRLIKKNHEVYALTRSESKIQKIEEQGAHGIAGDIRTPESFKNNLPAVLDIIVLLAMPEVKPGKRIGRKQKAKLKKDTNAFFRNAMDLAIVYNIPVILPGGTSFDTGEGEIADETWPILRKGLTEIGADTDEMVAEAIRTGRPNIIQLMYGKIYGNGGLFRFIYDMMEKGRSKIIGKGDNYIPNIHADDAAQAIVKAIEKLPIGERFIIADDTPVKQKDFMNYMAELMQKKPPGHIPGFLFKLIIGKDLYSIVNMNCKVSNGKAKRVLGWKPKYPSYKGGLIEVIRKMSNNE
jgi:nucleoside-diphosphate-sugar epimerase